MLRDELLLAWWRLTQLPGIGPVAINELRTRLGDPRELLHTSSEQLVALGFNPEAARRWATDASLNDGFAALQAWRQHKHCGVLLAGMEPYPDILAALPDAPVILYYHGDLACLQQPMIAMVGSRNPTPYAREWTQQTARELAATGVTVVSGLALGIDGAAHQGALESGRTVAVLGSGVDVIYPQRHLGLAQMIMHKGLLLSEFAPGTAPQPSHFPSRNRIVSGLSLGTVVAEAASKSGSLITAKLAAEQGREVFALPGAVTNPLSHGCHQLIRDGAILVQNAADILQELQLNPGAQPGLFDAAVASDPVPALLVHIDYTATSPDVIAIRSGLGMARLLPELLDLELQGWLQQVPGGYLRTR